jgi:SNF2 family DNA or RNA helicase
MAKKRLWAIGLDDDCIWIMTDRYDPDANAALKAYLPGPARWNRDKARWQFPIHWDSCTGARKVANKFGADLKMTAALVEWATHEKSHQDTIPDVQSMDLVDLPRVREHAPDIWKIMSEGIPELGYPPRPYQTVGAAFAARNRSCLIADQPGLGKTIQTIAAIVEADISGPILVVAPKAAVQLTWPQELKRWLPTDNVITLDSKLSPSGRVEAVKAALATVEHGGKRCWLITSPNYVRIRAKVDEYGNYEKVNGEKVIHAVRETVLELFGVEWSAIVVDESHQTLAGATGNKKKQSAQRLGLGALNVRKDGLRIALSGTPFRGKEYYLWGQLNWLRPDNYRSYWNWIKRHFNTWHDGYGQQIGKMIDAEAMYDEARNVMIRRTKEEVASDLPAKLYGGWPLIPGGPVAVWLDMEPKQAAAYESMVKKAEADLEGGTLVTNGILAELTRLKQFAGSYGMMAGEQFIPTLPSNKFDWLLEMLDERGIDGELAGLPYDERVGVPKVVVSSQFSQLINAFAKGLGEKGIKAHVFTGDTSDKKREDIKSDWQENLTSDTRVLLLTTTAGGVSLTLDAADELVLLDETWNTSDQEQVEDRLHRLSRIHQVVIWKVFSRGTIEEGIAKANLDKEVSIKSIIDGQRGVGFTKELLHP